MIDPRFEIAETYRLLSKVSEESVAHFEKELNNCDGADDAIKICLEWQQVAKSLL